VQLLEGHGAVIINGPTKVTGATVLTLTGGEVLKTLVQDGNYCGPTVTGPVTVAFVLAGSAGRVVALPVSNTAGDINGVPPCSGKPNSAGSIEMQPWAP
jgi:hypothetical protein